MPPWATPDHLRAAWLLDDEDLPADEDLTALLGRAQRRLSALDPHLPGRVAASPALAAVATDVVVDMVLRVLRNPEGLRTASETTGPITNSLTYGGDDPGALYVTAEEKRMLSIRPRRRQQAFSVPTRIRHGR